LEKNVALPRRDDIDNLFLEPLAIVRRKVGPLLLSGLSQGRNRRGQDQRGDEQKNDEADMKGKRSFHGFLYFITFPGNRDAGISLINAFGSAFVAFSDG